MVRTVSFLLPAALLALPAVAQPAADANTVLRGISNVRVVTILTGDAAERGNCLDDAQLPAIHDAVLERLMAGGVGAPRQRVQQRLNATATALVPQPNDTAVPLLTVTIEQAGAMFGADVGCSYAMVATLGALVRGGRVVSTGTSLPETRNSYVWLTSGVNIGNPEEIRERVVTTATEITGNFINGLRAAGFEAPRRDGPAQAGLPPNPGSSVAVPPRGAAPAAPIMAGPAASNGNAMAKPEAAPAQPPRPAAAAPAQACDRLAQPPRYEMGRVPAFADGVGGSRPMDVPAARAACARAMAEWPDEARFVAYAGSVASEASAARGIPEDVAEREAREAVRLYRLAAARGNAVAEYQLAMLHRFGVAGLERSDREVLRYYTLSAEKGHAGALLALAQANQNGTLGLSPNLPEAVRLFRLAAEAGHRLAANTLADAYENGRLGLAVNPAEFLRMLRLASDAGFPPAQFRLGQMTEEGRGGLRPDGTEALRLYHLAAAAGNSNADAALRRLTGQTAPAR
ncbi:tetratricopeptide repeat protein [Muricoccus radiodurans]|uniref:tetratricopeptide repeat protein n=1 Tax=Muricoccus radiodurans TaxID=2231721 RepID=UPI003CF37869